MSDHLVVACTVHDDPLVAAESLAALSHLDADGAPVTFCFAHVGSDERCEALLRHFAGEHQATVLGDAPGELGGARDALTALALAQGASHVLVTDTSLLLPPPLAAHLMGLQRDIVSEVFWSEWAPGQRPLPSVWMSDNYSLWAADAAFAGPEAQNHARDVFLSELRERGTYKVGGVSSCTMVRRRALEAGLRYERLPNLSLWDHDRHFSLRALALGFELWADTVYPPLHITTHTHLAMVDHFWSRWLPEEVPA